MDNDLPVKIVEMLMPFLPYLIEGGKRAAKAAFDEAGKKFVDVAWKGAESLWGELKPKLDNKPVAQDVLKDIQKGIDDEDTVATFRREVTKILKDNPDDILRINMTVSAYYDNRRSVSSQNGSVGIGGDVIHSPISINTSNYTYYLQPNIDAEKEKKALYDYLQNLKHFCGLLPLAALGDKASAINDKTLENVYIELDVVKAKGDGKKNPLSAVDAVNEEEKMVLLGGAGSGKSTFVKKLIGLQSAALLAGKQVARIKGIDFSLIPVYIELRKLSPRLHSLNITGLSRDEVNKKLLNVMVEQIRQEAEDRLSPDVAKQLVDVFLHDGKLLLVLDGLDEVPGNLRQSVRALVDFVVRNQKIERVIITSRIYAYDEKSSFSNFNEYELLPLSEQKIKDFVDGWYKETDRSIKLTKKELEEKKLDLKTRATEKDLLEMSSNPMMLTSMAILHTNGVRLPKQRVRLYNNLVSVLTTKWQEEKTGDAAYPQELRDLFKDENRLRKVLQMLAYETHCANYRANQDKSQSSSSDLSRGAALTFLEKPKYLGESELALKFLNYIQERSGILVGRGEGEVYYSFPHRVIQEYLAGCHLVSQDDYIDLYWRHAEDGDFWNLTMLLGAEELIYNRQAFPQVKPLIKDLTSKSPEKDRYARAALWAGKITVEYGVEQIRQDWTREGEAEEYLTSLKSHLIKIIEDGNCLSVRERVEAGNALGVIGDARFDENHWFLHIDNMLGFLPVKTGDFYMGITQREAETFLQSVSDKDKDELRSWLNAEVGKHAVSLPEYYIAAYPVTVSQFKQFFDDEKRNYQFNVSNKTLLSDRLPRDNPNHPITFVTWYDAMAYCKWLNQKMTLVADERCRDSNNPIEKLFWSKILDGSLKVTLPSEAEWEKAARGINGQNYPWEGNAITPAHANYQQTKIGAVTPVGCFPLGKSPFGAYDMSGNVWEWTRSLWGAPNHLEYSYPYTNKTEERENINAGDKVMRIIRGGTHTNPAWRMRCAARNRDYPDGSNDFTGFRVAIVPK